MNSAVLPHVLSMRPPQTQSAQSIAIWLDDVGLWEQYGTRTYLYLRMGPEFGVWCHDGSGWYEQMPVWPIVEPDGSPVKLMMRRRQQVQHDPELEMTFGMPDAIHLPETMDDALREKLLKTRDVDERDQRPIDDYVTVIPISLRQAIGRLSQFQWMALEAVCTVDGFEHFLEITISQFGPNLPVLAWQLGQVHKRPKSWRKHLASQMMRLRPTDLIMWLTQHVIAPGPMALVKKLNDIPADAEMLGHLVSILRNGEKIARLKVAEKVSHRLLKVFDAMPLWLLTPRIIALVARIKDHASPEAAELFQCAENMVNKPDHCRALTKYLEISQDGPTLIERLQNELIAFDWDLDHPYMTPPERRRQPFPDPPFAGGGLLKPILTERQLEKVGVEMRNCLHSYADRIRRGFNYCYLYEGGGTRGPRVAIVLRHHTKRQQWSVLDLGAANNRAISARTGRRVKAVMVEKFGPQFDPS